MRFSPPISSGVVGVAQQRQHRPAEARGGLDHVRDVALAGLRVLPLELLARELRVLGEVEVAAVGDALELAPGAGVEVLDVARPGGVVRELLLGVRPQAQVLAPDAQPRVPVQALLAPVLVPLLGLVGRDEELHLHLLELERAEDEVRGRDLVAERLADLRDAERRLLAREAQRRLEVQEDALRGLGAQEDGRALLLHRPDRGLEHQVERARLGQVAAADRALDRLRILAARLGLLLQRVQPEAPLALAEALHERVARSPRGARRPPRSSGAG